MNVFNIFRKLFTPARTYPRTVKLPLKGKSVGFEILSDVERYRTACYGGEKEFLEEFLNQLHPGDFVIDIGASVGLFTIHAAGMLENGSILAIEPDSETCDRLRKNIEMNGFQNVVVKSCALGNSIGTTLLYTDGAAGFAPTLKRQIERVGAPSGTIHVELTTLDEIIKSDMTSIPDVIKIDIEGAEHLCLLGANRLLSGGFGVRPRLIAIEIHSEFLPSFGSSSKEVEQVLIDFGYVEVWRAERDGQTQHLFEWLVS